jgi:tetraacyldisaccharide 4'-kinase
MNSSLAMAMTPLSAIYSAITRTRIAAYRHGWLSVSRLPIPVISVGNLTTGGTGKTPLVEWVCRTLAQDGEAGPAKRVCVLTRGYGRENPNEQVVVSDRQRLLASERAAGDEPFLLAQNLLGIAAVVANRNRFAAGEWAMGTLHPEVFVLDDGFQHLQLARNLDIVTIDATNPWGDGGGKLIPAGRLREPRRGLSRADCVVITRTEQAENLNELTTAIEHAAGPIPIVTSQMATAGIRDLNGVNATVAELQSQRLAVFCGVGNPESFFQHLRREGCTLASTRAFRDHHNFTQSEIDSLVTEARNIGASGLITTAKDAVKLASLKVGRRCYVLDAQIVFAEEAQLERIVRAAAQETTRQNN